MKGVKWKNLNVHHQNTLSSYIQGPQQVLEIKDFGHLLRPGFGISTGGPIDNFFLNTLNYKGLSIIFSKFRCKLNGITKEKIFHDCSLHHIFESENFRKHFGQEDAIKKEKKYSAKFPYLQPIMAELRRNQRGEIGRQHVKAGTPSATSVDVLITPRPPRPIRTQVRQTMTSGPTSPTPFRTMSRVLLRPLSTGAQR